MQFNVDTMKQKIQAILDRHKYQEKSEQQTEQQRRQADHVLRHEANAQKDQAAPALEPVAEEAPASLPAVDPEPTPSSHPYLFIEVRTPEVIRLGYVAGGWNDDGREVYSGKFTVSFRRRLPSDGDAEFVIVPAKSRNKPSEEVLQFESRDEWRSAVLNHERLTLPVDPRVAEASRERPQYCWGLRRNSGKLFWNGEVIP